LSWDITTNNFITILTFYWCSLMVGLRWWNEVKPDVRFRLLQPQNQLSCLINHTML
jgi:hypothetical protein